MATTARAFLKNYRQSPRKVRVVANLIKGKEVKRALDILEFSTKRAGDPIAKLVTSAVANAKQQNMNESALVVKEIRVDKGIVLKRMMPRARGRGFPIHKHTSRVEVILEEVAK